MKTLLLDLTHWDLLLDASGNIAVASDPYAVAQDVASAVKLFLGELWYDTAQGVPYFTEILGHVPPVTYFQELITRAALTDPRVTSAECIIQSFEDRIVTGQILFKTIDGLSGTVTLQ